MHSRFWLFLPVLAAVLCTISCAKERRSAAPVERPQKVQSESIETGVYLEFIRSEIERYEDEPVASLEAIEKAIKTNPNIGYFYYQRALIRAGSGKWDGVSEDCRKALHLDPKNSDAKILLAKALGVLKEHNEAIRYLNEVKKIEPDNEEIYQLLAKEYMNIEEYGQAEKVMRELLNRDSEAMIAYYYLGAIYGAYLKETGKAVLIYQKILEREPENFQVIDAISQLYLDMGRPRDALTMLLQLEKIKPNDVSLQLKIAQIYYKLKDYPAAIQRFEDILKKNPDSDKITYYLGILYEESGKFTEATEMYKKVPPSSGLYKDARLRLAYHYRNAGQNDRARKALEEAIRRQPKTIEFYQYLGGISEREGDFATAAKTLVKATRAFPGDAGLYFALGTLYEKMGDYNKALEAMRKVLKIDPKNAGALNYIGYTLVEQGKDFAEAESMLQEAVLLKPDDGFITDSLGWLYFKKGDLTKAHTLLERANKLIPNEPIILKHLGQLYLERGDIKDALAYFKKSLEAWQKKEFVDEKEIQEVILLIQKASNLQR